MLDARTLNFAPFEVNSMEGSQHNTRGRNKKVGSNTKQSTNQGNQSKHFPEAAGLRSDSLATIVKMQCNEIKCYHGGSVIRKHVTYFPDFFYQF